MTVTATRGSGWTGLMFITRMSGMTRVGSSAVRTISGVPQAVGNAGSATANPTVSLPANALTGNPTLVYAGNAVNPATLTPNASWTERDDNGTGSIGGEYATRDSGFISTVHNWTGGTVNGWSAGIIELDTSAAVKSLVFASRVARNTLLRR
jgi:hypothetical protein